MRFAALAILAAAAPAAADPEPALSPPSLVKATRAEPTQLAIAVNPPIRWADGGAVAASAYVGFARHHAIRANVARFDNTGGLASLVDDLFFDGDGDDAIRSGRNLDVGVGYMYFPRKLWSGPTLEAGLLLRNSTTRVEDEFVSVVETHTNAFAGRALVGWSWLFYNRAFVSLSVGASRGLERGSETTTSMSGRTPMSETHDVSRTTTVPEGFVRIGGVFDL